MRTLASSAKIRIGDINLKFRRTSSLEAWRFATLEIKERDTVAWLNHHANREKTGLIDVGANIGIYTLFWCAMGGDRSHAIEPLPQNLIALRRNLELNDFEKHVTVWSCAASDQNGWLDLWVPSEMPGEGMASSKKQHGTPIKVVAAQIDDLVSERDLNFVVKIDVEGAELDVLRGMHAVLSEGLVVSVLVERNENFPEVEAFLSECGMFRNTSYTGRNAVFDLLG